jgi:hypothetical protein
VSPYKLTINIGVGVNTDPKGLVVIRGIVPVVVRHGHLITEATLHIETNAKCCPDDVFLPGFGVHLAAERFREELRSGLREAGCPGFAFHILWPKIAGDIREQAFLITGKVYERVV